MASCVTLAEARGDLAAPPPAPQQLLQLRGVSLPQGTPAFAVGAVVRDAVVLQHADGAAAGAKCSAVETIFSVASISKLVLAVLTLQCAERGEISLDEDVNARLPPGCRGAHPAHPGAAVTPRMLLQHRSGLWDDESALQPGQPYHTAGGDSPVSLAAYVAERLGDPVPDLWMEEPPGEADYHYSNAGMTLLGAFLEAACGRSVAALARERVFAPLGMSRSAFTLAELPGGSRIAEPHGAYGKPLGLYGVAEYPAAGLRSTVHDLLLFAAQFTAPPGCDTTLLRAASREAMLPPDYEGGLAWWGLDASHGANCAGVWLHGGFMPGIRSHIYLWPRQRTALVCMQNGEGDYKHVVKAAKQAIIDAEYVLDPTGELALHELGEIGDDDDDDF